MAARAPSRSMKRVLSPRCQAARNRSNTPAAPARAKVGPVAQWLEPAAHNGLVAGSSPARPTTKISSNYKLLCNGSACVLGERRGDPQRFTQRYGVFFQRLYDESGR